jgi:hypothetical protein
MLSDAESAIIACASLQDAVKKIRLAKRHAELLGLDTSELEVLVSIATSVSSSARKKIRERTAKP